MLRRRGGKISVRRGLGHHVKTFHRLISLAHSYAARNGVRINKRLALSSSLGTTSRLGRGGKLDRVDGPGT